MVQLSDLASRLLRYELQLKAYQKLHADELAELWQVLNDCKREIVAALPNDHADDSSAAGLMGSEQPEQN